MKKKVEEDEGHDRDYLKGKDLSNEAQICRAKAPVLIEREDNFKFMQIDVDYYTES